MLYLVGLHRFYMLKQHTTSNIDVPSPAPPRLAGIALLSYGRGASCHSRHLGINSKRRILLYALPDPVALFRPPRDRQKQKQKTKQQKHTTSYRHALPTSDH